MSTAPSLDQVLAIGAKCVSLRERSAWIDLARDALAHKWAAEPDAYRRTQAAAEPPPAPTVETLVQSLIRAVNARMDAVEAKLAALNDSIDQLKEKLDRGPTVAVKPVPRHAPDPGRPALRRRDNPGTPGRGRRGKPAGE